MTRVEAYHILGEMWGKTFSAEQAQALSIAQADIEFVDLMPDDIVAVVRCKDCIHRTEDKGFERGHYCVKRPSNGGRFCEDNDFCSYGERREENA